MYFIIPTQTLIYVLKHKISVVNCTLQGWAEFKVCCGFIHRLKFNERSIRLIILLKLIIGS